MNGRSQACGDRTRIVQSAAAITIAVFLSANARGQCVLSGEVVHGANPIAGAEIVEERTEQPVSLGRTNLQGRFSVAPSPVPARWSKSVLHVRKDGFDELTLGLSPGAGRCPQLTNTTLTLARVPTSVASTTGTNLFVVPYRVSGINQGEIDRFNETLLFAIYNKVRGFRSQLEESTSGPLPEMGVKALTAQISLTDPEGVRDAGAQVNALGVITGYASQTGAAGAQQSMKLSSEFRVIARYPAYQEYHVVINDDLPGSTIDPMALSERLRDLWGKRATIALLVRALSTAVGAQDKAQLQVIRSWIIALRAKLGPEEASLARELDGLKRNVEAELQR